MFYEPIFYSQILSIEKAPSEIKKAVDEGKLYPRKNGKVALPIKAYSILIVEKVNDDW